MHVGGEVRGSIVGCVHQTYQERHSTDILAHITSLRIGLYSSHLILAQYTALRMYCETLLTVFTCHLVEGTIIFCSRSFFFLFAVLGGHRAKLSQTLPQVPDLKMDVQNFGVKT